MQPNLLSTRTLRSLGSGSSGLFLGNESTLYARGYGVLWTKNLETAKISYELVPAFSAVLGLNEVQQELCICVLRFLTWRLRRSVLDTVQHKVKQARQSHMPGTPGPS